MKKKKSTRTIKVRNTSKRLKVVVAKKGITFQEVEVIR